MHTHLKRLSRVWVRDAVYFVTICTHRRKRVLLNHATELTAEWHHAVIRHGWAIGRYVIMPDHVHFFCMEQCGGATRSLSGFIQQWKQWTAKKMIEHSNLVAPVWQKEFFDHILRSGESYTDKWLYVRDNPVRAGFVSQWKDWGHQGHVHFDLPN